MKKLLGMIICFCLLLFCAAALAQTSGSCGENLTYTLSDEGVLTISGTGDMTSHPWDVSQVTKVLIEEGVTSVANESFWRAFNLTEVSFPESLILIAENAFNRIEPLK